MRTWKIITVAEIVKSVLLCSLDTEGLCALLLALQIVRTLADQVRKREKTKRLLLSLWRQGWQLQAQQQLSGEVAVTEEETAAPRVTAHQRAGPSGPPAVASEGTSMRSRAETRKAAAAAAAAMAAVAAAEVSEEIEDEAQLPVGLGSMHRGQQAGSRRMQLLIGSGRESPRPVGNGSVVAAGGRAGAAAGRAGTPEGPLRKRTRQQQDEQQQQGVQGAFTLQQQPQQKAQRRGRPAGLQIAVSKGVVSEDDEDFLTSPDSSGGSDETYHGTSKDTSEGEQRGRRRRRVSYSPSDDEEGTEEQPEPSEEARGNSGSIPSSIQDEEQQVLSSEEDLGSHGGDEEAGGEEVGRPRKRGRLDLVPNGGLKICKGGKKIVLNGVVRRHGRASQGTGQAAVAEQRGAAAAVAGPAAHGRLQRGRGRLGMVSLTALAAGGLHPEKPMKVGSSKQQQHSDAAAVGARGYLSSAGRRQQQEISAATAALGQQRQRQQHHKVKQHAPPAEQSQQQQVEVKGSGPFKARTAKASDAAAALQAATKGAAAAVGAGAAAKKAAAAQRKSTKLSNGADGEVGHMEPGTEPLQQGGKLGSTAGRRQVAAAGLGAAGACHAKAASVAAVSVGAGTVAAAARLDQGPTHKSNRQPRSAIGNAELVSLGLNPQLLKSRGKKKKSPKGTIGRVELASLGLDARKIKGARQVQEIGRCTRRSSDTAVL